MKFTKVHACDLLSSKLLWAWVVSVVMLQLICIAAYGQDAMMAKKASDYETLEFDKAFKMIKTDRSMTDEEVASIKKENRAINSLIKSTKSKLAKALKNGTDGSMSAELEKYINGYLFPLLTQTDALSLSRLGQGREFFLKNFVIGKAPTSRNRVVSDFIMPKCKEIISGNFHPAVRMNAIVMVGLLNDAEAKSGRAPILTSSAFPVMKSVLKGDAFPDYLKVGALAGIQRHIEVSENGASTQVSGGDVRDTANYCIAVLKNGQSGQDSWSTDIDYWMKRRSAQILGAIGEPTREVLDVLLDVLKTESAKDQKDNYWVRADALVALASFESGKIEKGRVPELMDGVTGFTSVALSKEAEYLESTLEDLINSNILFADKDLVEKPTKRGGSKGSGRGLGAGGFSGGGSGGGDGPGRGDDEEEEQEPTVELPNFQVNASRQRIKIVLNSARLAFTRNRSEEGLLKIANGDQSTRIESILEVIDELMEKSEYGFVDRNDDDSKEPRNVTRQLADDYRMGSTKMKDLMLTKMEKPVEEADAPAAEAEAAAGEN